MKVRKFNWFEWKYMKKKTLWYSKKGISTIIATIIIVSVSIVMAIAVAYWAMGIGQSFQKFEKVGFANPYADPPTFDNGNFTVYVTLRNTGSATATITDILLNGRPWSTAYENIIQESKVNGAFQVPPVSLVNQTLSVGQTLVGRIFLPTNATGPSGSAMWSSGSSIEIQIDTAAGNTYSNTVVLP
jgi:archaeal type IV pilus assembly protein PilA